MATLLALQMSINDSSFWVMIFTGVVAVSFIIIAAAMVAIAVTVSRVVRTVNNLEKKVEPLVGRVGVLTEQVQQIAVQGKGVAEQVGQVSGYLSTATMHFSESMALVKEEVRELKQLVGHTAETARDRVDLISRNIDRTQEQFFTITDFIQFKLLQPARELAAIMAGVRRGLEVLVAPTPKQIDQTYGEEEMFIG